MNNVIFDQSSLHCLRNDAIPAYGNSLEDFNFLNSEDEVWLGISKCSVGSQATVYWEKTGSFVYPNINCPQRDVEMCSALKMVDGQASIKFAPCNEKKPVICLKECPNSSSCKYSRCFIVT